MSRTTSFAVERRAAKATLLTRTLGAYGFGILTLGCASNAGAPSPDPSSSDATETSSSAATGTSSSGSVETSSSVATGTSSSDAAEASSSDATETSSGVASDTSSGATEMSNGEATETSNGEATGTSSSGEATETSSSGKSDTSSDATSGNDGFKLTSPVLPSAPDCSAEKVDGCATFENENISYMSNANVSPALEWTGLPEGTKSLAITLTDVTYGQPLWAIWNIPASASGLPANLGREAVLSEPAGATQANALFAPEGGYFGPEAPCNLFEFRLFALSLETFSPTDVESGAAEVDAQLNDLGDALLGRTSLFGVTNYESMCEVVGTEG